MLASLPARLSSGTLYEGNFDAWYRSMRELLRQDGIAIIKVERREYRLSGKHAVDLDRVAWLVRRWVHPQMLMRLGTSATKSAAHMLRIFRDIAQPFKRFFELPAELRNDIYERALAELPTQALFGTRPPLLQASSRLRYEASSIYFAGAEFHYTISDQYHRASATLSTLQARLRTISTANLRLMNKLIFAVEVYDPRGYIFFHGGLELEPGCTQYLDIVCSEKNGLQLIFPGGRTFNEQSKAMLKSRAKEAAQLSQASDLKGGEAIMLFVTMERGQIWEHGRLMMKNSW